MFQYLIHGKKKHLPPPDFMKDLPFLSKSNMGLAAKQINFAKTVMTKEGVPAGTPAKAITGLLTSMTGRDPTEPVFFTMDDTPRIARWVEVIVEQGDDPLASLDPKAKDKNVGRAFAGDRVRYPTSLGGLGLSKNTAKAPVLTGGKASIPELIVELRRLPEIDVDTWTDFGLRWFDLFEGVRTQFPVMNEPPEPQPGGEQTADK
jgi:hypothetical protein